MGLAGREAENILQALGKKMRELCLNIVALKATEVQRAAPAAVNSNFHRWVDTI